MKRFVIAATGLALTSSLALAQTATESTTTTTTETAPVVAPADTMAQDAGDAAAAAGDKMEDAADKAENVADEAGNKVDEAVDTSAADVAEDSADRAEDAADKAEDKADEAVTAGSTDATVTTTTETEAVVVEGAPADPMAAPADPAAAPVVAPDVNAPAISAENPGMLASWVMNRRIWTTNQPSSTEWETVEMAERPAEWSDIAKVDDIVVDHEGNVMGYIADIGGFLGIGAKQVLLGDDVLHFVTVGDDSFFATNFTKEELEALPDFDKTTVRQ